MIVGYLVSYRTNICPLNFYTIIWWFWPYWDACFSLVWGFCLFVLFIVQRITTCCLSFWGHFSLLQKCVHLVSRFLLLRLNLLVLLLKIWTHHFSKILTFLKTLISLLMFTVFHYLILLCILFILFPDTY